MTLGSFAMKRMFFPIAAAIGLITSSAYAADMRMPMKAPPLVAAPIWTWTGFYIGVNGGYSWGRSRNDGGFVTAPGGVPIAAGTTSFNLNGGLAGGQIGYNWQMSNWLIGLEGDGQWASERGRSTVLCAATAVGGPCLPGLTFLPPGATGTVGTISQKIDAFGTFRGRLGWLVTPEVLLYGTGGLAVGDVRTSLALAGFNANGAAVAIAATGSTTRVGWTAGAGIEGMFARNWSAKLEYLYMDLGRFNNTVTLTPPGIALNGSSRVTDNILRAGVNYHF
jgi:outer membrane immunogenic protein